ncbi:hypothetical protein A5N78_06435 [Prescottella equi]|uniref:hypothetical protein n=1 Tax=Rhodococcus hoagii TaxID=43767 RepID=UPI0007CD4B8F|nr:hypothetical protein [Prescottella equi]NKV95048.1 hypothetical protein [Prescottella equi]NKV95049.1 hypothetical protein [Prescottella equi]NKV95300.1 hypothetical protein [Prescottella equi]NKW08003.1 hypothetical protein [Prescottella equi]ORL90878.1 hypothetical protein A5N78_06435 [Prescottella equi]
MSTAMLLPDCVLPGCRRPVPEVGQPCDECRSAFGAMLQSGGRPLTSDQIEARDRTVVAAYTRRGFT